MSDAEPAPTAADPTETSEEAFIAEHGVINWGAEEVVCKCGHQPITGPLGLTYHLFNASRSIMYRESAAILKALRDTSTDELAQGLHRGFNEMLAAAEAAELPPVVPPADPSTAST